jgi:tetratricopeptide (TPR) repeat protein
MEVAGTEEITARQPPEAQAIADYTEAIRLDPKYALAYNNRGNAYEKKGEKLKAAEDFARAKQLGLKP